MSDPDLVIRGGSVLDGTGAAERTADVAIRDGVVVEVGQVSARGRREIDAALVRADANDGQKRLKKRLQQRLQGRAQEGAGEEPGGDEKKGEDVFTEALEALIQHGGLTTEAAGTSQSIYAQRAVGEIEKRDVQVI